MNAINNISERMSWKSQIQTGTVYDRKSYNYQQCTSKVLLNNTH